MMRPRSESNTRTILTVILFLLLVGMVSAELSITKQVYAPGEIVAITLNYSNFSDKILEIITTAKTYTYTGTLLSTLHFLPQELGNHTIRMKNSTTILDQIYFSVEEETIDPVQESPTIINETPTENQTTILEKTNYEVGETVPINLTGINYTELIISFEDKDYIFIGEGDSALFIPKETGNYTLNVKTTTNNITEQFEVIPATSSETTTEPELTIEEKLALMTNIEVYHELPDSITINKTIPIRVVLWANQNDTFNITIREEIPENWSLAQYPIESTHTSNYLEVFIPEIKADKLYTFEYVLEAPNQSLLQTFETNLSYINQNLIVNKTLNKTVNVTTNGTYFDVEIDFYEGSEELVREIKTGVQYKGKITITNLGISVIDFPTYFDWDYDETLISITPKRPTCSIIQKSSLVLRCEYKTFLEDEIKTTSFHVTALKNGFQFGETITQYDPPLGFFGKLWNGVKGFFKTIMSSMSEGLTGNVVIEPTPEEKLEPEIIEPVVEPVVEPEPISESIKEVIEPIIEADSSEATSAPESEILSEVVEPEPIKEIVKEKPATPTKITGSPLRADSAVAQVQRETAGRERKGSTPTPISQGKPKDEYDPFKDPNKVWIISNEKIFIKTYSESENKTLKIFSANNEQQSYTAEVISTSSDNKKSVRLTLPLAKNVKKVEFRDLAPDSTLELGIQENVEDVEVFGRDSVTTFSIDPTRMNFTEAEITVTAQGYALWKCKDWNFGTQTCFGTWSKLMDVVPGKNYTFILTPEDPGYAETGLASINTNKSIYHPNESVEIMIVVLDTEGYFVGGANVTLQVTNPNTTISTLSTDLGTIIETKKGIYKANYLNTSLEGNYSLFVNANGLGVDSNMTSFFSVANFYDYDILRTAPIVIDPFFGPFNSTIKVITYVNVTTFNLTERVPSNFTITNAGGATVTEVGTVKELTWTNLVDNSEVSYLVQAPFIVPELWSLGQAIITSVLGEFIEVKPWYVAIDPISEKQYFLKGVSTSRYFNTGAPSGPTVTESFAGGNGGGTQIYTWTSDTAYSEDTNITNTLATAHVFWDSDTPGAAGYARIDSFEVLDCGASSTCGGTPTAICTYGGTDTTCEAQADGCSSDVTCTPTTTTLNTGDYLGFRITFAAKKATVNIRYNSSARNTYFNVTEAAPDPIIFPPVPTSYAKNSTFVYVNDSVTFNATWTDADNIAENWYFSWNITGATWTNSSVSSFGGTNFSTIAMTVDAVVGTRVGWRFYANDTDGNWNNTPTQTFVVFGTAPTTTITNPTNWTNITSNSYTVEATISGNETSIDTMTVLYRQNNTASWQTACSDDRGPTYDCVWDVTALPDGSTYEVRAYANDTTGNIGMNDTHYNITIDRTGPVTIINNPSNGTGIITSIYTVNASVTDLTSVDTVLFLYRQNATDTWKSICNDDRGPIYDCIWNVSLLPEASTYEVRAYANDTAGYIGLNDTHYNISIDFSAPSIQNEAVTPTSGISGTQFNITANIIDSGTIQNVWAEVMLANGTRTNYSMVLVSGNQYSTIYNSTNGGNLSVIIYAYDGAYNNVSATRQYFNVTANITTNRYYYERGESVIITGSGFYPGSSINVDIQDELGSSIFGYPDSATADINGDFTYLWNVSSALTFAFGNYTIIVNDTTLSLLNDQAEVRVIERLATAIMYNDNPGSGSPKRSESDILSLVNESDNTYANIISSSGGEVYLEGTFTTVLPAGYNINSAILYWEHYEISGTDTVVQWYNSTAVAYQTICTVANQVTETISSCDFSSVVNDSASVNSLNIRLTDNNVGANDENWTMIDFVFLDVDFNVSLDLTITINEPAYDVAKYNASQSGQNAYGGSDGTNPQPPGTRITGSEASAGSYTNLSSSDDAYYHSIAAGGSLYVYQSYVFTVSDAVTDISSLVITHEGFATETTTPDPDIYHVYVWNYTSATYQLFASAPASASDQITTITISGNGTDLINSSNGEVWAYVVGDFRTGGSGNAQADLWTDYMELKVNKIPAISGMQNINATVTDGDGVAACDYYYTYTNGTLASSYIGMLNYSNSIWHNTSNTALFSDGLYYIYVNCTDVPGSSSANSSILVKVANTVPAINLVVPTNYYNFTYSNINFTWVATQNSGSGFLTCNLSVDGTDEVTGISSTHGVNTTQNVSIDDGIHNWNVSCVDTSALTNTSLTWQFDVDTVVPTVSLNSPTPNFYSNLTSQTFYYTPSDGHTIRNCSFIVKGGINDTNFTIDNGTQNNFSLSNLAEGVYNWSVNCTDSFNWTGYSSTNIFTVDTTKPNIGLDYPGEGGTVSGGTVVFNYTITDNLDVSLLCNLTLDGNTSDTNFDVAVNNGTVVNLTESGIIDGDHNWSVTCWDSANNTNITVIRNFTMSGVPNVTLINPANNDWTNLSITNFTYYAGDGNGLANCSLIFDGSYNHTNETGLTNFGNNSFNLSNIAEGLHNWTANCTDTGGSSTQPIANNFTIDRTKPNIQLYYPGEAANFSNSTLIFNFTLIDNLDTSLLCNLSIDGNVSATNNNIASTNNTVVNMTETGIQDGNHNWSITCWDGALNWNVSETRNFTVDGAPVITLNNPAPDAKRQENVTFFYTASDIQGFQDCKLLFDGAYNQTNSTPIINGGSNNFSLTYIAEGLHNWTINCTDPGGQSSQPTARNITIDMTAPSVTALTPNGTTFDTNDIEFNFTVSDTVSSSMTCNVSVDGGGIYSSVVLGANGLTSTTINSISDSLHYWNVTCYDEANNSATSNTENFTIDAAPIVVLYFPTPNYGDLDGNITFNYTVDETNQTTLANCSLIINGNINQTKNGTEIPHVGDSLLNNFTLNNTAQGIYNWTVRCIDINGFIGEDTNRTLHVDWQYPSIQLNYPIGINLSLPSITFNWTVTDNVDNVLECNLSTFGPVNQSVLINATNNVSTTYELTGFTSGNYTWNVSCTDNSNLQNVSALENFSLISTPTLQLHTPKNASTNSTGNLLFLFTASDLEGLDYCDLYFDGAYNNTITAGSGILKNGIPSNMSLLNVAEGTHTWYINCSDTPDANKVVSETRTVYVDLTNPNATVNYPKGQTINVSSVTLNWTAYDNLDTNLTCNFTLDQSYSSDIHSLNASPTTYNIIDLNDSLHYWNVTCKDNGGRTNTSATYNFTIAEPPKVILGNPFNKTRNNTVNWTFYFTPTDNSGAVQNCTLILNGANNESNNAPSNGDSNTINVTGLTHGTYTWDVNCTDPSGNSAVNGTEKTFYIDREGPSINLTVPNASQTFNQNDIDFNWTPTDFAGYTIYCNLTVSDPLGEQTYNGTSGLSGVNFNASLVNLSDGIHWWNVTCADDLGNLNTSLNRNFTINEPDLYLVNANLSFNNTNPNLGDNITISAEISNIGGSPATNAFVEFWDGPKATGTIIGNATATVAVNASVVFNMTWIITDGYHNIWILADPNNDIGEENETNNNATINISILKSNTTYPKNDSWTNNETIELNFTLEDFTGGNINYSIFVNGVFNTQNGTVADNTSTLLNITLNPEGLHYIEVEATDSLGRKKNSTKLYINYDKTNPTPNFETLNGTFFNDTTPEISFNVTDNLASIINYTIYVDGTYETNATINVDTTTYLNLSALSEGEYNITLKGMDQAGNNASSTIFIFIDTTKPSINLTAPADTENFTNTRTVSLNFSVTDNLDQNLFCNLTLDGSVNRTSFTVANGSISNTTVSGLTEGTHYWNVTCWDGRDQNNIVNVNTSETRSFNIYIAPIISALAPVNNNWTNQENVTFFFNVSDETGLENCSILINGVINDTLSNSEITNDGQNNFTVNYLDGTYTWAIQCIDNSTFLMSNTSETRTIYIDLYAPYPGINTATGTWFNTATPLINFTINDTLDSNLNYTFFANGTTNVQGNANNATPTTTNLNSLADGEWEIWLEAYDNVFNRRNSSNITIYIDTEDPSINLSYPPNNSQINTSNVTFNFTATDNMAATLSCTLYLNGAENDSIVATPGIEQSINLTDMNPDNYLWNITCIDTAGNTNVSLTYNFTIPLPDLQILGVNIQFNNTSPEETKNVTINATIQNIGNTDAGTFTVQFFRGDPDSGGVLIGDNITVSGLVSGTNTTVFVNYTTIIGPNIIFVVVDPPLATSGSITELDETNNEANKTLHVGLFHIAAGTANDSLQLMDASQIKLFNWQGVNISGSNIYVVDSDSDINWIALQAIGINTSNTTANNDFEEIDTAFSSTNYIDSINATFTTSGSPILTRNFVVFNNNLSNVPIVNSTNSSNFVTGILWDYGDGGSEYSGTQDLVFITEINVNKTGQYGNYDFEVKVPALLRSYVGGGTTVDFYTEII
jgi:hypothetical protein